MKDKRFGDKKERWEYWGPLYWADLKHQARTDFLERVKEARKFLKSKIDDVLRDRKVKLDGYWYKATSTLKVGDFLKGRMFGNPWSVDTLRDTITGDIEDEQTRMIADELSDWIKSDNVAEEFERDYENFLFKGLGLCGSRIEPGMVDVKTGKLRVITECYPIEEILFQSDCLRFKHSDRVMRSRRLKVGAVKDLHPNLDVKPDMFGGEGTVVYHDADDKLNDGQCDYIEVEFRMRELYPVYDIGEEMAGMFGIESVLNGEEFQRLAGAIEGISDQADEATMQVLAVQLQNVQVSELQDWKYYRDVFVNGESVYDAPLELPFKGFTYNPAFYDEPDLGDNDEIENYPKGIIEQHKEEIILQIIMLTVLVRSIIRYDGEWVFFDRQALGPKADELIEKIRAKPGFYLLDNLAEGKAVFKVKPEEFPMAILSVVQWSTQLLQERVGDRPEVTGHAPYSGAPASLSAMLQVSGGVQLKTRENRYKRMVNQVVRQRLEIMKSLGVIGEEFDIDNVETRIDTRPQEARDAEALKMLKLYQEDIVDIQRVHKELGIRDGAEVLQAMREQKLGKLVMMNPDLMMMVRREEKRVKS